MNQALYERELREAEHYLLLGLVQPAADRLRRVLAIDPDDALAHALLSHCLCELRRPAAALHEAQLAIVLEPDSGFSHSALGNALLVNRDYARAEEHLRRALAIEPESAVRLLELAQLYRATERREARTEALARALELAPDDPDVLVASGQLALDVGDAQGAREHAEHALRIAPQALPAIVLMGFAQLRLGDKARAHEHAMWALGQRADDHDALQLLAAVKVRESLFLGLWWRYNVWMQERGTANMMIVLIGTFIAYRVLYQVLRDTGHAPLAELVTYAWYGLCAYTWVGPALFARALRKELAQVRLRDDF